MHYSFSITINKKSALIFILIISTTIVIDSTIVKFFIFSYEEMSTSSNVILFATMAAIFALCSTLLLISVKKSESKYNYKPELNLRYSYLIISLIQGIITGILILNIFQMVYSKTYSTLSLFLAVYITHISAILFLTFLVFLLVRWFRSNRNLMVMLYAISFSLISFEILVSLIYTTTQLSIHVSSGHLSFWIKPYPIHLSLISLPGSNLGYSFGVILDVLTLSSFVLTWIATATMLLRQYLHRLDKIKYWTIITIPLIYFLFPFETYFASIFHSFALESPIVSGIVYILAFSATKQVGGILFAMVFLTASSIIYGQKLRYSLVITAIGIAILFGSTQIDSLLYAIYPPYGLVTALFLPLGSYLLFTGIYASARFISQDVLLRKELYKSSWRQLSLLKAIGVTEMEKEIEKTCRKAIERTTMLEENKNYYLEIEDAKELVREVLNELYPSDAKERDNLS